MGQFHGVIIPITPIGSLVDNGPDLAEVQRRMTNLKRQFNKTYKVLESKGRHSKEAKAEFTKLGLIFQFLKFSPKMFEDLAFFARSDLAEIRLHDLSNFFPITKISH